MPTIKEIEQRQKAMAEQRERRNRARQAEMDACPHICAEFPRDDPFDPSDPEGLKSMQCPDCGKGFYHEYIPCEIHA